MKKNILTFCLIVILLAFPVSSAAAQDDAPVVQAVLFYSPTCGHCEYVITQTIWPMKDKYGSQLQIVGIDVTTEQGSALFKNAIQAFDLEKAGVPFLVIDDMYLIGSADIPNQFPQLIESYLAQGGVAYPNIPGLADVLNQPSDESEAATQDQPQTAEEAPQSAPLPAATAPASTLPEVESGIPFAGSHEMSWSERFAQDPVGNTLAVIVLIGMLAALAWVVQTFRSGKKPAPMSLPLWIIPLLCVIGVGVAGYLAYVETTQTDAICGPVGDCNTVQQSEYARLFGILPVGVLGLLGYAGIFVAWLVANYGQKQPARLAALTLFLLTLAGTLFSIYLTFLEPFVIGATCAWCLTSAILMTALMLITVRPAQLALGRKRSFR